MLMRTPLKTAEELGISSELYVALLILLARMERGELAWLDTKTLFKHTREAARQRKLLPHRDDWFNMNDWATPHRCGTVRCIGGWAEVIMGCELEPEDYYGNGPHIHNEGLGRLFHPIYDGDCMSAYNATVEQAAQALRNFLTVGEPRWIEVMAA